MKDHQTGKSLIIGIASLLVFLTIWELVCRKGLIEPLFLPAPSKVLSRAVKMIDNGQLIAHTLASTRRVMVGFMVSSLVAIPFGIFLGSFGFFRAVFDPFISLLRPLPSMSWIPLSLLWLGITETQKYAIVFMGSFAPSLLYIIEATKNIDPLLIRAARNLGASRVDVMREVILPGSLPQIIAGLKVMLGIAWTCIISAELVAARQGLGFMIMNGKEYFQTDTVLLGMVMISITVLIIDVIFRRFERRLLPWTQ
ncbi:MAG: ABC transporter permease [Deltaproteobacteria bacterium]|nr:ABC transporter permease [Deltaproteobacteria bacterium]MCF8119443.1 ABC transporter permease [Deltaproteobacteria bacterium]